MQRFAIKSENRDDGNICVIIPEQFFTVEHDTPQPQSRIPPPSPIPPQPPLSPSFVFRYPKFLSRMRSSSSSSSSVHSYESTGVSESDSENVPAPPPPRPRPTPKPAISNICKRKLRGRCLRFEALRKRATKQGKIAKTTNLDKAVKKATKFLAYQCDDYIRIDDRRTLLNLISTLCSLSK